MAKTHHIDIVKRAYPNDTKVAKGDTVVWTNKMSMEHTVTANNGEFDSGAFGQDATFKWTFNTAGSFPYHCEIHTVMKGKVTVT